MSRERRTFSAAHFILPSVTLTAAAATLFLVLALSVVPHDRGMAVMATLLALYLLTVATFIALYGLRKITANIRELHQLLARALTDPVTGLPVRRVAEDVITGTTAGIDLTVALADIDRLHDVNRGPGGHASGDRYLAEVGLRLRQAAVDGDTVARLGGDEFVVVTRRTPQQLSDSLTAAFAAPATIAGYPRPVEVSVGICQLPGGDPHQLLGCSSLAMFTAKDRGTGIEVYDPARDGLPLPPGVRPAVRRRDRRIPE